MEHTTENLLANVPCSIFSFREDGTIVFANEYFSNLTVYINGGLIGKHITDLLGTAGKIFYGTHFYPMLQLHGRADEIFMKFRSSTGKDIPVLLNAVITTANGYQLVSCACITVLNRGAHETELLAAKKKAEEDLAHGHTALNQKEEANKQTKLVDKQTILLTQQHAELFRLGGIISHDLQEPLRKLELYSSLLQQKQSGDHSNEKALDVIQKSAGQIRQRLLQLQAYLDIKRDVLLDETVNLTAVVKEQLTNVQALFPMTMVDFTLEDLLIIKGNGKQLGTLFFEMIKNAFVHGSINDCLKLDIKAVTIKENIHHALTDRFLYKDCIQITVADSGNGFDSTNATHIFEILNKMDTNDTSLGIGLSICKRIVEVHGGKIWANGIVGKGATFFVTLPINSAD